MSGNLNFCLYQYNITRTLHKAEIKFYRFSQRIFKKQKGLCDETQNTVSQYDMKMLFETFFEKACIQQISKKKVHEFVSDI
jgi:hypothetical protein